MPDRPLYQLVDENLRAAMACYGSSTPQGELRHYPGLTLSSSGVDFAVFNSAMLTDEIDDPHAFERLVRTAQVYFQHRRIGWSVWLCQDMLKKQASSLAVGTLRTCGLVQVAQAPGMSAPRLNEPTRALPELEYRPVRDRDTRKAFCDLTSIVFSLPLRIAHRIYGEESLWATPMRGWVGYRNGRPIATAASVSTPNSVGLYSVATLPNHQGRGYGEAMVRHVLTDAWGSSPHRRAVLQTTRAGLSLYKRLGFVSCTEFRVFTRESCDA